jgi:amino acid transporter
MFKYFITTICLSLCLAGGVSAANLGDAFKVNDGSNKDPLDSAAAAAKYQTANESRPDDVVGTIISTVLSVVGSIFIIIVVYGGFIWMLANGEEKKVTKAKSLIRQAIIGLIVVVAAYAISLFILSFFMTGTGYNEKIGVASTTP